jgi:hypothetical protein
VDEWWAVSGSPGELSGQSNGNWVLDEILWSQVSDFLLNGVVLLGLWEQFGHFLLAQFSNISNVGHGLDLLKMHKVMNHPELVVVVHGNIKRLHSLRSGSTLGNGAINLEFSSHEIGVFSLDLFDNIWGMDVLLNSSPVNWLSIGSSMGGLVVVVQDRLELRVLFS